ncbi:MAG TPA: ATP-binding cassette domain-containing protein, partial [Alphaproteobacteria bacterium]|nr:ATP-binding cassette domain-containing protein [Alphaproteobacteria bacterium]
GQALGVIGQSGSGKSTLARVLTGVWPIQAGRVRLDGASIEQYGVDDLANYVGYLPQDVALFEGTIAENIARLQLEPDSERVVSAAQKAAAHDLVLKLPNGYDTKLPATGQRLSGGQKQRIGLARALYGDPVLLVLDEPNANLDAEGSMALNIAIRNAKKEGRSVVIMAHRPAAIEECDLILILEGGNRVAFGPRDEVLKQHLRNYQQIGQTQGPQSPAAGAHLTPPPSSPPGQGGGTTAIPAPPKALPGLLGTGLLTGLGRPPGAGPKKPAEDQDKEEGAADKPDAAPDASGAGGDGKAQDTAETKRDDQARPDDGSKT